MKDKLSCEIVRDLLPLYVDKLTSDVTNDAIETHIQDCQDCSQVLESMKEPEPEKEVTKNEVDYLKKFRRKSVRMSFVVAVITMLSVIALTVVRIGFAGENSGWDAVYCNASVEGNTVTIGGNVRDSYRGITRIKWEESDGAVYVKVYTAPKTILSHTTFHKTFTAKETIKTVRFGTYILWENGIPIGRTASKLFADKNPYIGDMPANGKVAFELGIGDQFGGYKTELQTTKEPYGWKLIFDQVPIAKRDEEAARKIMEADSYVMLAVIQNMGYVTWDYEVDGKRKEYTVTVDDATDYVGKDIKSCAETATELQELLKSLSMKWAGTREYFQEDSFTVNIQNESDAQIYSMGLQAFVNNESIGTQGCQDAGNQQLKKGENLKFEFLQKDFEEDTSKIDLSRFTFDLYITDKEGKQKVVCENVPLAAKYGWNYHYILMDDGNGGFQLEER